MSGLLRRRSCLNAFLAERVRSGWPQIHFALATFYCRLGNLGEARRWWEKAVELGPGNKLKEAASEDPDLRKLWESGLCEKDGSV